MAKGFGGLTCIEILVYVHVNRFANHARPGHVEDAVYQSAVNHGMEFSLKVEGCGSETLLKILFNQFQESCQLVCNLGLDFISDLLLFHGAKRVVIMFWSGSRLHLLLFKSLTIVVRSLLSPAFKIDFMEFFRVASILPFISTSLQTDTSCRVEDCGMNAWYNCGEAGSGCECIDCKMLIVDIV